ncbi:MAG: hypothetical protein COB15_08770 [Flavobacteriales bacterium]|nr:MAG: hypothetical protein COB15_08770 [Flavobacteriales bacterium]
MKKLYHNLLIAALLSIISVSSLFAQNKITWTGNTDANWGTTSNWSTNTVPTSADTVNFPSGVSIDPVLDVDRDVSSITFGNGETLDLSNNTLTVKGDWTNNGCTFVGSTGKIRFAGSTPQSISGIQTLNDVEIDNSSGVNIVSGNWSIKGTLSLISGTLSTNDSIILVSDNSGTANISSIPLGADIAGKVYVQRYINAGSTNWHFFSSPVVNGDLSGWDDDLITSGIPGSDYPNWPSAANPWASIYYYDETVIGNVDSGFVVPASMSSIIGTGQGYWVWCGDTITGTQPFTIDTYGPINKGNINMPVSYTNSGNSDDDGWNMVGNPYPSTIDWNDANWVKTNIDDAVYVYDPDNLQYASYVGGVPNNGGTPYIASSQAFWVKANAGSPVLTAKEGVKSIVDSTFFKQGGIPFNINVLKGQYNDQVSFKVNAAATMNYDPQYDAYKFYSASTDVPSICAISDDNNDLSINSFNSNGATTIPIKVTANTSGLTQLSFNNIVELSNFNCVYLEDLQMGTFIDVLTSSGYLFYLYDTTNTARFVLHLEELTADFNAVDTVYLAVNNGEFIPTNNSTNATQYLWDFGDNNTSTLLNPVHYYTQPGLYNVTLDAIGMQSCTDNKTQQVEVISAVVTSLEKLSSSEINVYPNPIKKGNQLNFEIKESQKYYVEIIDLIGKYSFKSSIDENKSSLRIPDKFKSGIYLLTIYDASNKIINMRKISILN